MSFEEGGWVLATQLLKYLRNMLRDYYTSGLVDDICSDAWLLALMPVSVRGFHLHAAAERLRVRNRTSDRRGDRDFDSNAHGSRIGAGYRSGAVWSRRSRRGAAE